MKPLKKNYFLLIIILLLGFILRSLFITTSPPALYGDELTITLDAYSLLKTGQDQLGNFLPLTFPMGAGRPAGYVYGSIPFMAIFGPTAVGVRALSILSGLGMILLIYLLGKQFFSERLGIIAAFVGAVSPWDLSLSRGGFEAHFALFLALLGVYLFIKAKEKPIFYLFSGLSFGLTLHTYPTYKVSLLLFLPLLFWYESKHKEVFRKKQFLLGVTVLIILGTLALSQTFIGGSEKRFTDINIFSQGELKNRIEQKIILERQISNLPQTVSKYFYNKPLEYSKVFIENYLQNFSLDFLILHGDRNPRHNMATMGEIYFIELILIFIGFLHLLQNNKKTIVFLILWILLSAVPSAIVDSPHALRSSFMLPPLILLSALGFVTVLNYKNKIILFLISLVFIIQFIFFIQKIYFLSPNEYSSFWSYPAKLASGIAIANKDKYNYIVLSNKIDNIEFAYPIYAKSEPNQIIDQNINNLNNLKRYGNVYIFFGSDEQINTLLQSFEKPALYIGTLSSKDYLDDYELIEGKDKQTALTLKKFLNE